MNHEQAAGAMAVLRTAYNRDIDEQTMQVWYGSALERCAVDVARQVVERIVNEDQFFPTPARFNEVRRAVERAMEPTYAALPAAPEPPATVDRVKQIIAETRSKLRGSA